MFSNDARWDCVMPSDEAQKDVIAVATLFRGGRIIPCMFSWDGRKYTIKEVTCFWKEKKGEEEYYHFSVTDGANLYQIALNVCFMSWRLVKTLPL